MTRRSNQQQRGLRGCNVRSSTATRTLLSKDEIERLPDEVRLWGACGIDSKRGNDVPGRTKRAICNTKSKFGHEQFRIGRAYVLDCHQGRSLRGRPPHIKMPIRRVEISDYLPTFDDCAHAHSRYGSRVDIPSAACDNEVTFTVVHQH
jgi:hypothetical protein